MSYYTKKNYLPNHVCISSKEIKYILHKRSDYEDIELYDDVDVIIVGFAAGSRGMASVGYTTVRELIELGLKKCQ